MSLPPSSLYPPAPGADDLPAIGPSQGPPPSETRRRRAARACIHCRKRHWKCKVSSGQGTRCDRCLRMNLHCEYLPTDATATSPAAGPHNSISSPGLHPHRSADDRLSAGHDPRGQEISPPFYSDFGTSPVTESPSPPPYGVGPHPALTLPSATSIPGSGPDIGASSHIPPIHDPYPSHGFPSIYSPSTTSRPLNRAQPPWYSGSDGGYRTYPGEAQGAPYSEMHQGWPGVTPHDHHDTPYEGQQDSFPSQSQPHVNHSSSHPQYDGYNYGQPGYRQP